MKISKYIMSGIVLLGISLTVYQPILPVSIDITINKEQAQAMAVEKLEALRLLLNKHVGNFNNVAFLRDAAAIMGVLLPVIGAMVVGYTAFKKTFGGRNEGSPQPIKTRMPARVASIVEHESAAGFFNAIKSVSVKGLQYIDMIITQLETQYQLPVNQVTINGASLLSAAVQNKNLDPLNKVELIKRLQGYGVNAMPADIAAAEQMGNQAVIKAIKTK